MIYEYVTPNGVEINLYPISYLAKKTYKSESYIRVMTSRGVLPKTPFKYRGRNYYTDDQIRTLLQMQAVHSCRNMRDTTPTVEHTFDNFIEDGRKALMALYRCYGVLKDDGTFVEVESHKMKPIIKDSFNLNPISYKIPNGMVYLYSIYYLAKLLNRTTQVIRKWELAGIIPQTPFRTKRGIRLYTYEQILCIVKCVKYFKIRNGVSIENTGFTDAVKESFDILLAYYGFERNTSAKFIVDTSAAVTFTK